MPTSRLMNDTIKLLQRELFFSVFDSTESEFIAATVEGLVRRDKEGVGLFGKRSLWSKQ